MRALLRLPFLGLLFFYLVLEITFFMGRLTESGFGPLAIFLFQPMQKRSCTLTRSFSFCSSRSSFAHSRMLSYWPLRKIFSAMVGSSLSYSRISNFCFDTSDGLSIMSTLVRLKKKIGTLPLLRSLFLSSSSFVATNTLLSLRLPMYFAMHSSGSRMPPVC